jgi:hypothetical protein
MANEYNDIFNPRPALANYMRDRAAEKFSLLANNTGNAR